MFGYHTIKSIPQQYPTGAGVCVTFLRRCIRADALSLRERGREARSHTSTPRTPGCPVPEKISFIHTGAAAYNFCAASVVPRCEDCSAEC
jgi:hypothetical protein